MNTSAPEPDPRALRVSVTEDDLTVHLHDGRVLSVPLVWFPRLVQATPAQPENHRLIGEGDGVHWPDLNEDVSVRGLLRGWASGETVPRAG